MGECRVFPKLFIGAAAVGFNQFLKKNGYNYTINYITDRDDLIQFIETYSAYKNYTLPVIVSDISFLNKKDQSLLLKFIDDSNLNIIMLASRDNILDTIVSRVKELRKFYVQDRGNRAGFIDVSKARSMCNNDNGVVEDISEDDKMMMYNKYNPALSYDDSLVKRYSQNDRCKLLNLLEFSNE